MRVYLNRQNLLNPDKIYVPIVPKLVKLTIADKKVCTKVTSKLKFLYSISDSKVDTLRHDILLLILINNILNIFLCLFFILKVKSYTKL